MTQKRILIVDDDTTILTSFGEILRSKGYKVDTAETGSAAIDKCKSQFFNLALLDIKLPDMEGTDLLSSLHSTSPTTMKIMVTGYASLENAVAALNLGADAYLLKPVDPEGLLRVVRERLEEQERAESMNQDKISDWIENRVRQVEEDTEDQSSAD